MTERNEVARQEQASPPARLHCLLAREAPVGVVLRRGPSDWVQCIRWDTARDTFDYGQWFHGKIYADCCDLSPDGTLLVYFAGKYTADHARRGYGYTWTAISRPPYYTALALWPQDDAWGGGGFFLDNRTVVLERDRPPHPDHLPPSDLRVLPPAESADHPRLLRQLRAGWTRRVVDHQYTVWVKTDPTGGYELHRTLQYPTYTCDIAMSAAQAGDARPVEVMAGTAWADWDQQGRIVFVRDGKLFAARVDERGTLDLREMADFNAARPARLQAPAWARSW